MMSHPAIAWITKYDRKLDRTLAKCHSGIDHNILRQFDARFAMAKTSNEISLIEAERNRSGIVALRMA